VKNNILADKKIRLLIYCIEWNGSSGNSFRDAYKAVAEQLETERFNLLRTKHTHEGSINNLCLAEIKEKMKSSFCSFSPSVFK
jgi:argininosuccinate lyase